MSNMISDCAEAFVIHVRAGSDIGLRGNKHRHGGRDSGGHWYFRVDRIRSPDTGR